MRYASVRSMDISNGQGIGVALFVQGCHFHCPNCFNSETWDFSGGEEWTEAVKTEFIHLAGKSHISRISILGGEPLAPENLEGVCDLVKTVKQVYPDKMIWLYSGYEWERIRLHQNDAQDDMRRDIIAVCDVLVDGLFVNEQRNLMLKWRGSSNQRVLYTKELIKDL